MPAHIAVIEDLTKAQPTIQEGPTAYVDLVGTGLDVEPPLVAGIWTVDKIAEATPSWESEINEFKYVVGGQIQLKDDTSGRVYDLKEGSLVWIPKGAKVSIVKSEGARFVYVEQRQGEPTVGTSKD